MKISGMMKSAMAALLILSVVATSAFAGSQNNQVQVTQNRGERYAYVWVTGSRIPQKVKISPIGTLTQSPLSEHDRRQINWTRGGTAQEALSNEPSVSFRGR
jgi:SRSO17 transposase